jgi:leucyl aminopeptidase
VEIVNTDAEGRLILADALSYAGKIKPDITVDVATLTASCRAALGTKIAGLFTPSDSLADELMQSSRRTGERIWRLPLAEELRGEIKSRVADLKNLGGLYGGAIAAALFLREFAPSSEWAHIDMAGPVLTGDHSGSMATGFGVALLVDFVLACEKRSQ